jgi:hypothetical protein
VVLRSPLDLQIVFGGEIRGTDDESTRGIETAPYSCQEGPSFALTSAYTLATDFVGVLPIAEGLTILVVVVSERGCRDVERPIKSAITTGTAMPRSPTSKSSTYTPPHWPKHIRYLTAQQYHSSVKKDVLEIIRGQQPPDSHQPLKPSHLSWSFGG